MPKSLRKSTVELARAGDVYRDSNLAHSVILLCCLQYINGPLSQVALPIVALFGLHAAYCPMMH
jgi:hypothetical protein